MGKEGFGCALRARRPLIWWSPPGATGFAGRCSLRSKQNWSSGKLLALFDKSRLAYKHR